MGESGSEVSVGMANRWRLKRTSQCAKCPWRVDVDPYDIPNGYCATKHAALERTIAVPGALRSTGRVMACHETHDAHCIGWLVNQVGPGNNIPLRIQMMHCENVKEIRLQGEQHETFEDTLPVNRAESGSSPTPDTISK